MPNYLASFGCFIVDGAQLRVADETAKRGLPFEGHSPHERG